MVGRYVALLCVLALAHAATNIQTLTELTQESSTGLIYLTDEDFE